MLSVQKSKRCRNKPELKNLTSRRNINKCLIIIIATETLIKTASILAEIATHMQNSVITDLEI